MSDSVGLSDPALDCLALMRRDAAQAQAVAGCVDRHVAVGGAVALLRFVGAGLEEPLMRAIRHLVTEAGHEPGLTVTIWDSASTGVVLSPLLRALVDSMNGNPFSLLTPRHEIAALTNDRVGATYELGSGVLTFYDRSRHEAFYWVQDADQLPYYELGAPLRTTFNWWLTDLGLQCIHAAAVGTETGALLLTGRGGSGKSTTALACLDSSLKYLADDYCIFSTTDGPEVFSLYNTGKLRDDVDLARQPHCKPWIVNPDRTGDQKYLMFLAEHVPERLLARAPLRAIVLPRVTGGDRPRVAPVSSSDALRALAPTSMFQLPGSSARTLSQMAALARMVPCFSLECSTDLRANSDALAALLDELT